jgi:hypothetical protein
MPILILFAGPTRTASTSLYFSQASTSLPWLSYHNSSRRYTITKSRNSENPYLPNLRACHASFQINSYKKTFINPKADIFVDYCPSLFHNPDLFLRLSSTLSDNFSRVIVITFIRSVDSLVQSTLRYNLHNQHTRTVALFKSNPDELVRDIYRFFDYQKWFDALACSSVSCRFIIYDAFITDQPRVMSCLSKSIVGADPIADAFRFPMPVLNNFSIYVSVPGFLRGLSPCLPPKLTSRIKDFLFELQARRLLPKIKVKSRFDLSLIPNMASTRNYSSVDDLIGRLKAAMNFDLSNIIS